MNGLDELPVYNDVVPVLRLARTIPGIWPFVALVLVAAASMKTAFPSTDMVTGEPVVPADSNTVMSVPIRVDPPPRLTLPVKMYFPDSRFRMDPDVRVSPE